MILNKKYKEWDQQIIDQHQIIYFQNIIKLATIVMEVGKLERQEIKIILFNKKHKKIYK